MNSGRRKDVPPATSPADPASEGLVTSEDLFGDLVDASFEAEDRPTRAAPIRVRVREQLPAEEGPKPPAEILPADVAALLEAFSEPGETAARQQPAPPARDPDDLGAFLDNVVSPPRVPQKNSEAAMDALLDRLTLTAEEAAASPPPSPEPKTVVAPRLPGTAAPGEVESLLGRLEAMPERREEPSPEGHLDAPAEPPLREPSLPDEVPVERISNVPAAPPPNEEPSRLPPPPGETFEERRPALVGQDEASSRDLAALGPPPLPEEAFLEGISNVPAAPPPREEPPPPPPPPGETFEKRTAPAEEEPEAPSLDLAALAETALAAEAAAHAAPSPGERTYGPYQLLEKVAVGGMAEVFRAKRSGVEGFEKVVAVKRILPHLSDNKEFVDMFINEAKMVAGLTHPNIVQIFDLGKIEKSYYIAMEYVHGRDLRSIQKRARDKGLRIPLDLSVLIVSKICLALEYAHRKKDDQGRAMRIVHRDVSPQNVLISYEGEVKLTDFGIAKAVTKAPTTDAGALRGKLLYMSPEQAWGKAMDRRSDLFSLGIIFYELITEQKPFLGTSEVSILELVRECRVTPPRTLNPRIPEKLEAVVMTALHRAPDQRYQDAGEMFRDLERALAERKSPTGAELARFMEILFEATDRQETVVEEGTPSEASIEIEFDSPTEKSPKPARRADPMSIEKLLARFGIK
jgi:serine/threonine protein kinase